MREATSKPSRKRMRASRSAASRIAGKLRSSITEVPRRRVEAQFCSCHTLASYASFSVVPFIGMHTPMVGQRSRNPVIFAVYEGRTHRRPTSEGNAWLGFESLRAHHSGADAKRPRADPRSIGPPNPLPSRRAPHRSRYFLVKVHDPDAWNDKNSATLACAPMIKIT